MHIEIPRNQDRTIRVPADVYDEDGAELDLSDDLSSHELGFAVPGDEPASWETASVSDGRITIEHGPGGDIQLATGYYDLWARVLESGGGEARALVSSVGVV